MPFKAKVVVVTGGAQGIWRCCTECFEREGATVHVTRPVSSRARTSASMAG